MCNIVKKCSKCKLPKSVDEFYRNKASKDGYSTECKKCRSEYNRSYKESLTEDQRKAQRIKLYEWRKKVAKGKMTYSQVQNLRFKYGITEEEYYNLLKEQNNKCAICKQEESVKDPKTGAIRILSVDHCHIKQNVRKLLCNSCNVGLGYFKDNPDLLREAAKYIEEFASARLVE